MKENQTQKEIALSVLKSIFSPADVKKFSKLRGIVMCGLPGCGKSTIAELLHDAFDFAKMSTDDIRIKEMYKHQGHRSGNHEEVMLSRYMVYGELAKRVNKKLNDKKKVVVDGTHLDEKRFSILGALLSKVPSKKMAMILIRTPEWILKKRFKNLTEEEYENWWKVYKFWVNSVKDKKAHFPTKKELSNIQIIKPKRYAIRTFDWVPDIKAIVWDVDGTFYRGGGFGKKWTREHYKEFANLKKISLDEAKKRFEKMYEKTGSRTTVLDNIGIDGKTHMADLQMKTDFTEYFSIDKKLRKVFRKLSDVTHYISSNSAMKPTLNKIKALGINKSKFEKIFVTHDFGMSIKDEEYYKTILRRIKLKPEQILVVGDRASQDIVPAKKLGMRTCMVWGVSKEADVSLKTVYGVAGLFGKEV